ncbi:hypothetical protein BGW38_009001 [Lunasporangiospora selenospora]|uniref:Uncharacterized protein n=1 Tax=Lunasporangiospora selenospora TaxID=979761 RepID=A0A9P6K9C6_9FUNG|nr:hypothetical protein BGW38_009001 [Lunasporangiospora selenospora]
MAGLFFQRYRARSRSNAINSHQSRSRTRHNQTTAPPHLPPPGGAGHLSSGDEELQRGDKAKLAKSFTIRKPPSVYVDDDQDLDQTGHPRYNSDGDARHHPYYGHAGPGGLVEYELSDTRGQQYEPTSVAERKRYVEQQHRKVMEEYEMYNPHKDMPPPSPYPPSHGTAAPSYTSGGVGGATSPPLNSSVLPSMGGRSPRVNPPGHPHSPSPFGRSQDDYPY